MTAASVDRERTLRATTPDGEALRIRPTPLHSPQINTVDLEKGHEEARAKHFDGVGTEPCDRVQCATAYSELPNRLMTAFEVAEYVGCHEETVRRAYLRGLLVSQRFGVRNRRFRPADVADWIQRGAPTRVS